MRFVLIPLEVLSCLTPQRPKFLLKEHTWITIQNKKPSTLSLVTGSSMSIGSAEYIAHHRVAVLEKRICALFIVPIAPYVLFVARVDRRSFFISFIKHR